MNIKQNSQTNLLIRNFAIIAHIDHGKTTLADRLIEYCGGLEQREMSNQVLDSMDIEKERGITIKTQTVRLMYKAKDGLTYQFNLMDTPGHVDFAYEVSRGLAACEGALLVVDAAQGVEAQTLANVYMALDQNLAIIPIINKIDLPAADPEKVRHDIEETIGIDASNAVLASAKQGIGIEDILESIIKYIPCPERDLDGTKLQALLIDSWYNAYLGVVILFRIFKGKIKKGNRIKMLASNETYLVDRVGFFTPKEHICDEISDGEIGFFTATIKDVGNCKVGDTIYFSNTEVPALPGFKEHLPVVFCGIYPVDTDDFEKLKGSLDKLHLNDSSFSYETESSNALGYGFRCGFLGLLHLEIIQERLIREFDVEMITTAPSVIYRIYPKRPENNDKFLEIHNPAELPEVQKIDFVEEPWVKATIMTPEDYLGAIIVLCNEKRGRQVNLTYSGKRPMLVYKLPLNEVVFDFYDKLKSLSKGYASFDWEIESYEESDLVKLDILVNHEPVDALSIMVHRTKAEQRGRDMCKRLQGLIPSHLFQIAIQAAIGGKIIARENIKALRKDVLAKCYGGDITRKRKLLDKQKKGKERMKRYGNVDIPHEALIKVLTVDK